jgi:hypothetical protein
MRSVRNVAVCLAIMGVGLPATADVKSIHGAICQPTSVASGASVGYQEIYGVVAVGGNVQVVCPLMRDRMNSTSSLTSMTTEVYVPSGGGIDCTLYSQTEDGSAGYYVDVDSASRTTAGEGQITLYVDSSSGNEGAYGLYCSMSENSAIRHIYTSENDGASD